MFGPISPRTSAASACAAKIREQILAGHLAVGSRLPPERQLASQLGVNRLTLRAALTELRAAGLLAVRHGSGTTVLPFTETGGPALFPALVAQTANNPDDRISLCTDLLLLRRHLAAAALDKLSSLESDQFSKQHLEPIANAIAEFTRLANRGAQASALAAADINIVGAILAATGSVAFRLVLNPLSRALEQIPELAVVIYRNPKDNAIGYQQFLKWFEDRDRGKIAVLVSLLEVRDQRSMAELATLLSPNKESPEIQSLAAKRKPA